jgi:tetratricopeptide (TPR) repeat protein
MPFTGGPLINFLPVYRLGLLLYSRAKAPSLHNYLDSIVWFPKLNKELFIDTTVLKLAITSADYKVTDLSAITSNDSGVGDPTYLSDNYHKQVNLPGTGEVIHLADAIYMPRQDGIRYLLKATEFISDKATQADIQYKVGDIYLWAGSNKQAFPYYAKSVDLAPGNANTRLQLVDAGVAIYKNRATLEQLNYLYDSGQINFPKRMLLAEMAMYAGQFDQSKKLLDEARQIHPFNHDKFAELNGRINLLANKPDEAIAAYKMYVTEINPDDAGSYYTIARMYAGKQNSTEAFRWLKKAINNGFKYTYVLELDPVLSDLRKKPEWDKLVAKPMKTKLKQKGVLFDY